MKRLITNTVKATLVIFLLMIAACKKDEGKVVKVKIKSSETYIYSTGIGGDEEAAVIKKQAGNYEISEIKRDKTTGWVAVYYYKPKSNFSGKDVVEIETYNSSPVPTEKRTIKIIIKVDE